MDTPTDTGLNPDILQEISDATGTSSRVGGHAVGLGSLSPEQNTETTAEPGSSLSDTSLNARTTSIISAIDEKSKSMGIGGFFRALWNYISNSSTKSMDQAKLNVVATDYLKANPEEVDGLSWEIVANTEPRDSHIIHAFAAALKEVDQGKFENFCGAVKDSIEVVLTQVAQTPSGITSNNIKHAADLVGELKSVIKFSPPTLALHSLAQKLSADKITPELIAFCKDFPEQAQALGARQDLRRTSFQGTDVSNGLTLTCNDSKYNPDVLNFITQELFEGEDRYTNIANFLKNPAVTSIYFCFYIDGIQRCEMPHIVLPNGVEILSNFGGTKSSEYCKSTGKPYDQAAYLKYMLDQFKTAYGSTDEAVKAFKVLVQNFTGSGNTFAEIRSSIFNEKTRVMNDDQKSSLFSSIVLFVDNTLQKYKSQPMMRMDEGFNIGLSISACISDEGIQQFNEMKVPNCSFPQDTIFGITINSYIPAAINDTMD
ncbi:MAG: hypothetical protein LBC30_02650, partial [Puniceicoccales bacterium]|nr:hypothetical protein [Puniceicoccales bacterium]